MHELSAYALTLLLAVARPPAVDVMTERPRIEALAVDLARVVTEADELAALGATTHRSARGSFTGAWRSARTTAQRSALRRDVEPSGPYGC